MSGQSALFNLPEIPDSSVTELLTKHARSYNTERSGVGYVACRCGLDIRLNDISTADDARTFAAHQAQALESAAQHMLAATWDEGCNAVWTFMSNQDPRRERPSNPYRPQP